MRFGNLSLLLDLSGYAHVQVVINVEDLLSELSCHVFELLSHPGVVYTAIIVAFSLQQESVRIGSMDLLPREVLTLLELLGDLRWIDLECWEGNLRLPSTLLCLVCQQGCYGLMARCRGALHLWSFLRKFSLRHSLRRAKSILL